jgi:hypothetical protein
MGDLVRRGADWIYYRGRECEKEPDFLVFGRRVTVVGISHEGAKIKDYLRKVKEGS